MTEELNITLGEFLRKAEFSEENIAVEGRACWLALWTAVAKELKFYANSGKEWPYGVNCFAYFMNGLFSDDMFWELLLAPFTLLLR